MRYYAKFNDGCQTKNKAQEKAYAFMKTFSSVLLGSDAALEKMVADMRTGVDLINRTHNRCSDISFSSYLKKDYRGNSVNVGDICSFSFFPVVSDFDVVQKEPEQETEETQETLQETLFNF
jgi:hypothetical protein